MVVFHEQVIEMIAQFAGCSYAEADEARRALGDVEGMAETKLWFFPRAMARGYSRRVVEEIWKILEAFASFGFCKAHAAAFALPTYQSAWLKAHYPAHFLSGVLTHDPGMYPKRLILDDARQFGIAVLGLDVNASEKTFVVERVGVRRAAARGARGGPTASGPSAARAYGIRLALSEVKGISEAEVDRIVAARPYQSLTDFWQRARVSRPVVERLVLAGGFDGVYGIGYAAAGWAYAAGAASPAATCCSRWPTSTGTPAPSTGPARAAAAGSRAAARAGRTGGGGRPGRGRGGGQQLRRAGPGPAAGRPAGPARRAPGAVRATSPGTRPPTCTPAGSRPGSGSSRSASRGRPGRPRR